MLDVTHPTGSAAMAAAAAEPMARQHTVYFSFDEIVPQRTGESLPTGAAEPSAEMAYVTCPLGSAGSAMATAAVVAETMATLDRAPPTVSSAVAAMAAVAPTRWGSRWSGGDTTRAPSGWRAILTPYLLPSAPGRAPRPVPYMRFSLLRLSFIQTKVRRLPGPLLDICPSCICTTQATRP